MELLNSNNNDDCKSFLTIKKGLQILLPFENYHISKYEVVLTRLMELPCSSVGVVDQVSSTLSTQTPYLVYALLDNGSLVICIYDHIVALENKQNFKSDFRATYLGSFFYKCMKYLSSEFNGNAIFELPLVHAPKIGGRSRLEGMDR